MSGIDFDEFKENSLAVDFDDPPPLDEATQLSSISQFDLIAMLGTIVMFEIEFDKTISGDDIFARETLYDLYLLSRPNQWPFVNFPTSKLLVFQPPYPSGILTMHLLTT